MLTCPANRLRVGFVLGPSQALGGVIGKMDKSSVFMGLKQPRVAEAHKYCPKEG